MNPTLLYALSLGVLCVSDPILPHCLMLYGYGLFKTGSKHRKAFYSFYNRMFIFRTIVNAIALIPACFLKYGDQALIVSALVIFFVQVLFCMWRAELYAQRQSN